MREIIIFFFYKKNHMGHNYMQASITIFWKAGSHKNEQRNLVRTKKIVIHRRTLFFYANEIDKASRGGDEINPVYLKQI